MTDVGEMTVAELEAALRRRGIDELEVSVWPDRVDVMAYRIDPKWMATIYCCDFDGRTLAEAVGKLLDEWPESAS